MKWLARKHVAWELEAHELQKMRDLLRCNLLHLKMVLDWRLGMLGLLLETCLKDVLSRGSEVCCLEVV
ncbi:hypothetical protein RchiOBHm_Chr7g0183791 [Rosa chinensis]|uniref:Uncharacterized protein n=1 Tax=Rosa chinensis TaxID=74649 RepID=A0A2P6P3A3_ROSCH|nr:hypothetical protein RchiOBHm_Chr7g0183791 [Rosa chinensis]